MPARSDPSKPTLPAENRGQDYEPTVLRRFVRRLGRSSVDCEDIVQEAYLRLLESSGSGRSIGSQLGYLLVIARNLVNDAARRASLDRKRSRALEVLVNQLGSSEPSAEEFVFAEQCRDQLARTLRTLPARCRHAFLLHRFRAMSHAEIAKRLGVTTRTVERDVAFVLAQLKEALFEGEKP